MASTEKPIRLATVGSIRRGVRFPQPRVIYVPNKQSALAQVASSTAAWLQASMVDEITGFNEDGITAAEVERLKWAIEEVQRRLRLMGKRN